MANAITPDPVKAELRKDVQKKLNLMNKEEIERQSRIIVEKVLNHKKYKEAKRISLFMSLPTEVSTMAILEDVLNRGDAVFVPQYVKGTMRMLRVMPGDLDIMVETSWKIKQHGKDSVREDALDNGGLDLVITPGAAFTRSGGRVGHGGGYYDRYLTKLQALHLDNPVRFTEPYILGVCFNEQLYQNVPLNSHDVVVDEVLTAE